jgi:hypothetical protein
MEANPQEGLDGAIASQLSRSAGILAGMIQATP